MKGVRKEYNYLKMVVEEVVKEQKQGTDSDSESGSNLLKSIKL